MEVRKWLTGGSAASVEGRAEVKAQGGYGTDDREEEDGEHCQSWKPRIFSRRNHIDDIRVCDTWRMIYFDQLVKDEDAGRRNCGDSLTL